jgi:protein-L-isoaspartate O-methyltransferase
MGIRNIMMYVLIVVALIVAGCSPEKPPSQKPSGQSSTSTTQPNSTAGQPASPDAAKAPAPTPAPAAPAPVAEKIAEPPQEIKRPDVIFVPTPDEVVAKMLELAKVTKDDVVYDLGCGDGRIVVAAAKLGCKAYGFDVDPQRIKESNENVQKNGVGNLATIEQKDIFTLDLSKANVVTLYLLPSLNVKLIPQLEQLKPGSRIVSHDFDMRGVTPDQVVEVTADGEVSHTVYLWTVPLKKEQDASN